MFVRSTVVWLSFSQLICWGISYYLIGAFGDAIATELGWSLSLVHGGFTVALLTMGACSPMAGNLIDRYGGRYVMAAGSLLNALGCVGLAVADSVALYYGAWVCLGVAMRLTLYDAAFAALVRIEGPHARRSISQVTLMGGLASTVFWPLGQSIAAQVGWRGALLVYAACALATVPLHLAIPDGRYHAASTDEPKAQSNVVGNQRARLVAGTLYALIVALMNFLNSGMSAHMIDLLVGLGVAASAAVWIAALRGVGQSSARLGEVLFGAGLHPLRLHLGATLVLPACFAVGFMSDRFILAAAAFAFLYGAGNGLVTITRGTLPTVLFDYSTYGAFTGKLGAELSRVGLCAAHLCVGDSTRRPSRGTLAFIADRIRRAGRKRGAQDQVRGGRHRCRREFYSDRTLLTA